MGVDWVILNAWLIRILERLVEELHYREVKTGPLAVWVGDKDGRAWEGRRPTAWTPGRPRAIVIPAGPVVGSLATSRKVGRFRRTFPRGGHHAGGLGPSREGGHYPGSRTGDLQTRHER